MKKKILRTAKQYVKQDQRRRNWRKLVRVMACVVVFCTTYALILPAVTLEKYSCGLTEHIHSESCYEKVASEAAALPVCGYDSQNVHEHGADCYETCLDETGCEQKRLICTQPTEPEHTHDESCCLTEEVPPETGDVLICGLEEHTHTDECRDAEEIRGELVSVATEPAVTEPGMELMAELPRDYLVEPTPIDGCNVTWAVFKNDLGEYVLRFDGEGPMTDYGRDTPGKYWADYLGSSTATHVEFGDKVTSVGAWSLSGMTLSSIKWGGVQTIKTYAFSYGKGPADFDIPETVKTVEKCGVIWRTGIQSFTLHEGTETLGSYCLAATASSTLPLHIPASVTEIGGNLNATVVAYTVAEGNPNYCAVDGVLYTKDMKKLISYPSKRTVDVFRIPDGVETVGSGALEDCKIGKLVISPSVKELQANFAESGQITEIYFEDGCQLEKVDRQPLYLSQGLTNIRYPENTETPLHTLFHYTSASNVVKYAHFTVPNKITSIGYMQGNLLNLETLTYNAENAQITTEKLFESSSAYDLIIDDEVNHLPTNFSCFVTPAGAVYFRGENTFTADSGAFKGAGQLLENLSGKFHVDENGVLYQCMEDGTAKVVYVSPDAPADLSIPATVQTSETVIMEDGTEYTVTAEYAVTAVGTNAFRLAENLTALTFVGPERITSLESLAMANCPALIGVNGKTTQEEATAIFTGVTVENFGSNVFYNTGLDRYAGDQDGDGILDGTGYKNLTVKREGATDMDINLKSSGSTMQWVENTDGTGRYRLLTGDTVTVTASVGNTEGKEDYIYRVYFRITGEAGALDILPGQSYTFDGQTAICCPTEEPNTVYLEFHPTVGATVNVPVTAVYPSPDSAGGGVEIWGVILDEQEAAGKPNALVTSENLIQAQWTTQRDDFQLSKTTGTSSVGIVSNGSGAGKPSSSIAWTITLQRATETASAYGKDYAESVVFTDTVTLPEGFSWNPKLVNALQQGPVKLRRASTYQNNFQIADVLAATVYQSNSNTVVKSTEAYWDAEKNTIAIRWEIYNGHAAEMNANTVTFTILPEAVSIDMAEIDTSGVYTVRNDVTADVRYHYSDPVTLSASADRTVKGGAASLRLSKSSTGAKYFGEDVTYTIDLYNNGAVPYADPNGMTFTVEDELSQYSYIKPEKMEEMFRIYGTDLVIHITDAVLAPWQGVTGVDGRPAWQNSGNSDLGTPGHTLNISVTEDGKYQVIVDGENTCTADTAAEALRAAGYAVTVSAKYKCVWTLHEPDAAFMLDSGEHRLFYVHATVKDSFGIITKDWPNTYPSTEPVSIYNKAVLMSRNNVSAKTHASGGVTDKVKREASVEKSVYKGNEEQHDSGNVDNGDVLTYHLDFYHYGTGSYKNLSMVDDLYGSQYLLVPVDGNNHLADRDLLTHEDGGVVCYVLKEGSYTNVTVGVDDEGNSLIAASVTVSKATDELQVDIGGTEYAYSGIHTQIKWYFPEKAGEEYWMQVRYKALVDLSQSGVTYTIGNAVWMNDRKDTRIYDFIWGGGTIIDFKKEIVIQKGDTYLTDATEKYSQIPRGAQVLYRLTLHNTANYPFRLPGEQLADALPETFGIFQWDASNVELAGIETDSDTVECSNLDQWTIADSHGGLAGEGRQYIVWPENAAVQFMDSSTVYLYFTLTYPDNGDTDLWNQYAAAVGGNRIFNTLYVYRFPSTVEHDLQEPGKVLLQKGVSGMYYYGTGGVDPEIYFHPSGTSRVYYNNEDARKRAVMYYVTLYNGGNKRLYLDDLYDRLPQGFSFLRMINGAPEDLQGTVRLDSIITPGGVLPGGNGLTDFAVGSVVYRSALVVPELTDTGVMFRFGAGTGDYTLRYDQEKGKFYLNCGEAIAFAYTCNTGKPSTTEEVATNTIAMPYHDYLDTGLTTISAFDLPVGTGTSEVFLDTNDGTRLVMPNRRVVEAYGFPSSGEQEWLVSDVTVLRGGIRPGVTKYTDAYSAEGGTRQEYRYGVVPTATVHWRVRLHNAGTLSLLDYTFSDIMPDPYVFEGNIAFQYYDVRDNLLKTQNIATLPQRGTDVTSISVVTGEGKTVTVPLDGTKVSVGTNIWLSIGKDERGNEVLSIDCKASNMAISEGGYIDVTLSSRNPTNDHINAVYTNRATLYPNAQPFDNVGHGSMLKDGQGNPIGAENYSPVNVSFGYATSSEKRVTEDSRTENTAVSTDPGKNSIILESAESTFTYQLSIGNDTEMQMTKLVVIDNLPEPGDHTPFDTSADRNSAFTVYFAEDSDFAVKITDKDGTVNMLESDQYSLEFLKIGETVDFGRPQSADWRGEDTGKWTAQQTAGARAFRLIIRDDSGTLIPHESRIDITFKAKADANAEPGTVAWNSFGYHYGLKNVSGELEAMPLVVGVAVPDVPALKKQLVSVNGNDVKAPRDLEFSFLVYEGAALTGSYDSPEAFCEALDNAGRAYQVVTVPVAQGQTESAEVMVDDVSWTWSHGSKYTVAELDSGDKFSFLRFEGADNAQYTFTYDESYTQTVVCENRLEEWTIQVTKTDVEGKPLSGAVFGLYGPSEDDKLSGNEWNAPLTTPVATEDGTEETWYLKAIAESDAEGKLAFTELREERYYLLEIKAPDGYNLPEGGQIMYQSDSVDGVRDLQVINEPGYELPETGGMGTTMLYVFGGTMMLAALVLLVTRKRMADAV